MLLALTRFRGLGPTLALALFSACSSAPQSSAPPPATGASPVNARDEAQTQTTPAKPPAAEMAPPPPAPPPPPPMAAPPSDKGAGPAAEKKEGAKASSQPSTPGARRNGAMGQGAGAGMGLRPCCQALLQSAATTPAPGNQATQDAAAYCQSAVAQATPSDDAVAEIRQRLGGAPLPASCR